MIYSTINPKIYMAKKTKEVDLASVLADSLNKQSKDQK
jgi:hypothetical protein